jgi:hypothetical protein
MNPFFIYFIVSIVASIVWTFFALRASQRNRLSFGLAGAWAATLVLAAFWQAEAIPWLWNFLQGVLLVWLSAIVLLVMAAATMWSEKQSLRFPLVSCALISIVVNVAAGLHFLWIATVGPGGV